MTHGYGSVYSKTALMAVLVAAVGLVMPSAVRGETRPPSDWSFDACPAPTPEMIKVAAESF